MSVVAIKVNGKDYSVACDNGEEERLIALAAEVDERVQSIVFGMKNKPNEAMGLLLAALMMADEIAEKTKENKELEAEARKAIARASVRRGQGDADGRMAEMEAAMAATMEEIASRIEKIADQIEVA